jgi:hypothetical protein
MRRRKLAALIKLDCQKESEDKAIRVDKNKL